jgi:hypothetical protein
VSRGPRWTEEEDQVIRDYYWESGPDAAVELLPRRSKAAVCARACEIRKAEGIVPKPKPASNPGPVLSSEVTISSLHESHFKSLPDGPPPTACPGDGDDCAEIRESYTKATRVIGILTDFIGRQPQTVLQGADRADVVLALKRGKELLRGTH